MLTLLAALVSPFVLVDRNDPITLERQAIYGTEFEGNTIGLVCRPAKSEIQIIFIPRAYYKPDDLSMFFDARADSRFGAQAKAEKDAWYFDDGAMFYVSSKVLGNIDAVANFIDQLAKDNEFNIRIALAPDDVRTTTLNYRIDQTALKDFIGTCGPKRVIAKLRAMGSPAAPD